MLDLLLALQAVFAGPQPVRAERWLGYEDYPDAAVRGGITGSPRIALTIDATGRPRACAVVMSSGSDAVDRAACRLSTVRGRFRPARDARGAPLAGVWTTSVVFYLPGNGTPPPRPSYDVAYPVNRLPAGTGSPFVGIEQLVAADGRIEGCHVAKSSGSPPLDALACRTATTLPVEHVVGAGGQPMRAVVSQTVLFTTGAGEPAKP